MTAEGSMISLPDSSQMEDWVFLNSLAWVGSSVPDHWLKMILKSALPKITQNYFTKQPILEAFLYSEYFNSSDYSYIFVKAVLGETFCPDTKNIDRDAYKECLKRNMEGSLKLCTIHIYYKLAAAKFQNIIKCWEMNDYRPKNDYYLYDVRKAVKSIINRQIINEHHYYASFHLKNIDRIHHLDLKTPEIWYDQIFYLKFQVQQCLEPLDDECISPDDESKILTCSGEIDVSSKHLDLYEEYIFDSSNGCANADYRQESWLQDGSSCETEDSEQYVSEFHSATEVVKQESSINCQKNNEYNQQYHGSGLNFLDLSPATSDSCFGYLLYRKPSPGRNEVADCVSVKEEPSDRSYIEPTSLTNLSSPSSQDNLS
ncbi:hypothetical protein KQX54_013040, partial [Cotesia glomerata]